MQNSSDPSHQDKPGYSLSAAFRALGGFVDTLRLRTGIGAPENLSAWADQAVGNNDPSLLACILKQAASRSPYYEYGLTMHSVAFAINHANPEMVSMLLDRGKELASKSAEFALGHPFRLKDLLKHAEERAKELRSARVAEDLDEAFMFSMIHRRGDPNIYQLALAAHLGIVFGKDGSVSRGQLARAWREAEEKHRAPGTNIYVEMRKTLALMQSAVPQQPRRALMPEHFNV